MNPLILALDVEPKEAKALILELKDQISIFKIGSRLFTALGPKVVDWVLEQDRQVFLDLKFHDIPLTVAEACRHAVELNLWGFTLHSSGGFAMMREAARATQEQADHQGITAPLIFGVTVLTSLGAEDLKQIGVPQDPQAQVQKLAQLAQQSGLNGVVASGNEVEAVRKVCGPSFLVMTPGIRSEQNLKGEDQKRVMTPRRALELGANYLVVGRPILSAPNRAIAAQTILDEIKRGVR